MKPAAVILILALFFSSNGYAQGFGSMTSVINQTHQEQSLSATSKSDATAISAPTFTINPSASVVNSPTISSPSVKQVTIIPPSIPAPPPVIPPPAVIPPIVYMFSGGQEPVIQKMPKFAYAGTEPLRKGDKICGAVRYPATGKNLFMRVMECHKKTYLEKRWNPRQMRMLVVKFQKQRSFSTSGSVSSSWSTTDSENQALQTLSKNSTQSLYSSGSIAPSFSQSWVSESFDLWFFNTE